MDQLQAQVADLMSWRESAQKQISKLFAELHSLRGLMDKHVTASEESRNAMHTKLDEILTTLQSHEEKDTDHDARIAQAEADREELKKTVSSMVSADMKSKGLPQSGKRMYGMAGAAGAVGSFLMGVLLVLLAHLPELAEFIVTIWKGIQ